MHDVSGTIYLGLNRDQVALACLQGLLANANINPEAINFKAEHMVRKALLFADVLLKEIEKEKEGLRR